MSVEQVREATVRECTVLRVDPDPAFEFGDSKAAVIRAVTETKPVEVQVLVHGAGMVLFDSLRHSLSITHPTLLVSPYQQRRNGEWAPASLHWWRQR